MQGFMYYLPGVSESNLQAPVTAKEKLESLGLAHLEVSVFPRDGVLTSINMFGSSGVMLIPNTTGGPPDCHRYEPANQTWLEFGKFWIGVCNNDLPTAESLMRKKVYPGYDIVDTSGKNSWMIPIARSARNLLSIPSNYTFDANCNPVAKPKPEFDWLWELSGKLYDHFMTDGARLTLDQLVKYTVLILGVNYKIGFAEIAVLSSVGVNVIDGMFAEIVSLFVIDDPLRVEHEKKTANHSSQQETG